MVWIGAIGGGTFILVSLFLGLRMLLLAQRTRGVPELTLGLGLFLMGGVSYPIVVIARLATSWSDPLRIGLMVVAQVLMLAGTLSLATFNWRVFRPTSSWAFGVVAGIAAVFIGLFAAQCLGQGLMAFVEMNEGIFRWSMPLVGVALGWGGIESLRYYGLLKRRLELGLADPAVTDRMRMWGVAMLIAWSINIFSVGVQSFGYDPASSPVAGAVTGVLGLLATGTLSLAFFPPRAYRERVGAKSDSAA